MKTPKRDNKLKRSSVLAERRLIVVFLREALDCMKWNCPFTARTRTNMALTLLQNLTRRKLIKNEIVSILKKTNHR